jgi:4'-phosphopantetheinyl transferase
MFSRSVDVLVTDLSAVAIDEDLLSVEELGRALRFSSPESLTYYLAAHVWLRRRLAEYLDVPAAELCFENGEHGKPALVAPSTDLSFNLAYSGWSAVLAIGFRNDLGVDIEAHTGSGVHGETIDRTLTPRERDIVIRSIDRERAYLGFWVRKEALAKATGIAVDRSIELTDVSGLAPVRVNDHEIIDVNVGDGLAAAVAVPHGTTVNVVLDHAIGASDSERSPLPLAVAAS